jgi:hypothetical protein
VFQSSLALSPIQATINVGRPTAYLAGQRIDLVLHQRDKWRDNQRRPLSGQQGRKLITKRLAAAGRQDNEYV